MLTIRCAQCKGKLFRYIKIGKGKIWRCYKDRIMEDFCIYSGDNVMCTCGSYVGFDKGKWIKMKQNTFYYSGTKN
jgi:hypothetical protein